MLRDELRPLIDGVKEHYGEKDIKQPEMELK
jgi:hypothetical protein